MSRQVDERVVSMKFDNNEFDSNIRDSMSTLDKLKEKLKFEGVSDGFNDIEAAADDVDFSNLNEGVNTLSDAFSALGVIGRRVLENITDAVYNTGVQFAKSLSIDNITSGMAKYEQKTANIQTLVNSTGKSVEDINKYLGKLMKFSDETSYSFSDMTAALSTMSASGGDVEKLIPMLMGIANATAYAGKGANEFSRVIYNLGQSYSQGYLSLMDWKSVQGAGVNSKQLTEQLIRSAEELGKIQKGSITLENFTSTLQKKWADTEVMEDAFHKFSALTEAAIDAVDRGEFETVQDALKELAVDYDEVAVRAAQSASEAKTFGEAVAGVQDAVSSGWMQSFELIFGNYDEAKELWTEVYDILWDIFAAGAEARNEVLKGWNELGGRNDLITSMRNLVDGVTSIVTPIKEAFREIFPATTSEQLKKFTEGIADLTSKITISNETSDKLKRTFEGLFSIFDIFRKVLSVVVDSVLKLAGSDGLKGVVNSVLDLTASLGDMFSEINQGFTTDGFSGMLNGILGLVDIFIKNISSLFSSALNGMSGSLTFIFDGVKEVATFIKENIDLEKAFKLGTGAGIVVVIKKIVNLITDLKDSLKNFSLFGKNGGNNCDNLFSSLHDALENFTSGIKVTSLVAISAAVLLLAESMRKISELDLGSAIEGIAAIGALLAMLSKTLKSMTGVLSGTKTKGLIKSAASLVIMAEAIKILSDAVTKLGSLSLPSLIKGLGGAIVSIYALAGVIKIIDNAKIGLTTSVALLAIAEACKILSNSVQVFADMSVEQLSKGIIAMGVALAELVAAVSILNKFSGGNAILGAASLLIITSSLGDIATELKRFGNMREDEIVTGLVTMGAALSELVICIAILKKVGGFSSLMGSISAVILVQTLEPIADFMYRIGKLSWKQIAKGLTAMGVAFGELVASVSVLSFTGGFSSMLGSVSAAILISTLEPIANFMDRMSNLSWESIKKGLVAMGVAMAELVTSTSILGKLAGLSSILGAISISIITSTLDEICNFMDRIAELNWEEIAKGLTAMGGALLEVSLFSGALGMIAGFSAIFGASSIYIVAQGLEDISNSLVTFGSMSWEEIGRGLTAMGGALAEVALFSGALGTIAGFGAIIGGAALSLATQGLDELADSLVKLGSMSWEEVQNGLTAMGAALSEIAVGSLANTLSWFGASAISTIAEPLGVLADSVNKWKDVSIPEGLGDNLKSLGKGIFAFTLDGLGATAIKDSASALGVLADSVKKWKDANVPADLGTKMHDIASAIMKFSLSDWGAENLKTLATPFGNLATSVKKWIDINIPTTLYHDVEVVRDCISLFTDNFSDYKTISNLTKPIEDMYGAISKWTMLVIPENLSTDLLNLSSAIVTAITDIDSIIKNADDESNLFKMGYDLFKNFCDGVEKFTDSNFFTSTIKNVVTEIIKIIKTTLKLDSNNSVPFGIGVNLVEDFIEAIEKTSKTSVFIKKLQNVFTEIIDNVKSVFKLDKQISEFTEIGRQVMNDLAIGIEENSYKVINAVSTVCNDAVNKANELLGIHSPSRVFYDIGDYLCQGLANGISENSVIVDKANEYIADAIRRAKELAEKESAMTITPVLDLSQVEKSANRLNSMVSTNKALALAGSIGAYDGAPAYSSGSGGITFNQYNTSPKALAAIDIYRNTNSQLAQLQQLSTRW